MNEKNRRYLILARVDQNSLGRAREFLWQKAQCLSKGDPHLAFASEKGETMGILIHSQADAGRLSFEMASEHVGGDPNFVMVIEVGEDWSAAGNPRTWEWLQRHNRKTGPDPRPFTTE
jgi:hypothetical protein